MPATDAGKKLCAKYWKIARYGDWASKVGDAAGRAGRGCRPPPTKGSGSKPFFQPRIAPDLYFRLNVFKSTCAVARPSRRNIPLLTEIIFAGHNVKRVKARQKSKRRGRGGVDGHVLSHTWTGKTCRELRNVLER